MLLLFPYILRYCCVIQANSADIISFCSEMSVSIFVFQVCMSVEYHQCAFSLQISYKSRNTLLWRNHDQHMNMVAHQMPFYNFYPLVSTQGSQYFSYVISQLIVDHFSSILWCEDDVIFAHPLRMCQRVCFLCHFLSPFLLFL